MHAAEVLGPDGVPTLRLWEYERLRRVVFQVDASLPPSSRALLVCVRIRNPNPEAVPMYWWSNAAVPERDDVRVIAPARSAYTTDGPTLRKVPFPLHEAVDQSRPTGIARAADFFYDVKAEATPWIAAVDATGHGLGQVSTDRLRGRKMFCWGAGSGGRRWQRWLSPEGGSYLEIQAGLATTQLEHLRMPAGATWSWVEAYGDVAADPEVVGGDDWEVVTAHVGGRLEHLAPTGALRAASERAAATADVAPTRMLCMGSGWGTLEREVREATGQDWLDESGTPFLPETLGPEQEPWLQLLHDGEAAGAALSVADPATPPSSYVSGSSWERLLSSCPQSWARDYHLGVLAHADGDLDTADQRYSASTASRPTAWALRGAARVARERGNARRAAELLEEATAAAPEHPSIRVEAVTAALDAGDSRAALRLVDATPPAVGVLGRLRMLEAQAALASGDRPRAARLLTEGVVVPDLREGETALSDLWTHVFPDDPLPEQYDFRMR